MARHSLSPMNSIIHEGSDLNNKPKMGSMTHLKYLRKRNGYTLEMLSDITSISVSYLSRLESGSRRLNTDLIKRLSHAFNCDPAELLQEITHDTKILMPIEHKKHKMMARSFLSTETTKDLPVYKLMDNGDGTYMFDLNGATEWHPMPKSFSRLRDVFALQVTGDISSVYTRNSLIYCSKSTDGIQPASTIIYHEDNGYVLKKVWSITPAKICVCNINDIDDIVKGLKTQNEYVTEKEKNILDDAYRVLGYFSIEHPIA